MVLKKAGPLVVHWAGHSFARSAVLLVVRWVGPWVDWAGVKAASWAANLAEDSVGNSGTLIMRKEIKRFQ